MPAADDSPRGQADELAQSGRQELSAAGFIAEFQQMETGALVVPAHHQLAGDGLERAVVHRAAQGANPPGCVFGIFDGKIDDPVRRRVTPFFGHLEDAPV